MATSNPPAGLSVAPSNAQSAPASVRTDADSSSAPAAGASAPASTFGTAAPSPGSVTPAGATIGAPAADPSVKDAPLAPGQITTASTMQEAMDRGESLVLRPYQGR